MKKNPIGITMIGDPYILKAKDGKYYIYATTFVEDAPDFCGFYVWTSEDLESFSEPTVCYRKGSRSFGYKDYWAPEVVEIDGKYVMHYSARRKQDESLRIGVAVSDSPTGPFIDVYDKRPMFESGCATIDGHVFIDDDGKKYFYYSKDCSENIIGNRRESHIYVARLSDDLLSLTSSGKMVLKPEKDYEKAFYDYYGKQVYWNEGPFLVKHNGLYHLMYSANFFASANYCICCAVSKYPDRDFVKYDEPVLKSIEGKMSGPGHNSVLKLGDNEYVCVYHVLTDSKHPSFNRQIFMSKMKFVNDRIVIENPEME